MFVVVHAVGTQDHREQIQQFLPEGDSHGFWVPFAFAISSSLGIEVVDELRRGLGDSSH